MKERGFAILATMFAVTSLDLDDEGKRELARKVHADLGKIITYTNGPSLTFSMVERERRRVKTMDQTVFFVCVPPYIKEEKKKRLHKLLTILSRKMPGSLPRIEPSSISATMKTTMWARTACCIQMKKRWKHRQNRRPSLAISIEE